MILNHQNVTILNYYRSRYGFDYTRTRRPNLGYHIFLERVIICASQENCGGKVEVLISLVYYSLDDDRLARPLEIGLEDVREY
jgi:hypothetical protein